MNIEELLGRLHREQIRLEGELAGRRSQLDRTISIVREMQGEPAKPACPPATADVPPELGTSACVMALDSPNRPEPPKDRIPKPAPLKRRHTESNGESGADKVRRYICAHQQFGVREMLDKLKLSQSAGTCAILKMVKKGELNRIGYRQYERTPKFVPVTEAPDDVAKRYAEFRKGVPAAASQETP